ncbi:MAG: SPOR domain-containing protein [Myxococcota bacterium]
MSIRTRVLTAALAAATLVAAPATASACWDGVYVETDTVSIAISTAASDAQWSPERARSYAKWAGRIGALVPEGTTVSIEHGYITVCDETTDTCRDIEQTWDDAHLFNLFELTADVLDAPGRTIAAARRTTVEPLTVQAAATRDLYAAYKMADRINAAELGIGGFLDVGGFPSVNEYAHVVESWKGDMPMYHVVAGTFLNRADAKAAAVTLHEELGVEGFVRVLDQSSVEELGC